MREILVQKMKKKNNNGDDDENGDDEYDDDDNDDDASLIADFFSSSSPADADATINQFLRAVGGSDARAATKRLLATLRWRREASPSTAACETCLKKPGSHYQHVVGADYLGRPVIYSVLALARGTRDVAENTQHMISVFEAAIRMMEHNKKKSTTAMVGSTSGSSIGDSGSCVDGANDAPPSPSPPPPPSNPGPPPVASQWVWVSDLHGFSPMKDLDPRVARAFIGLLGTHYPERLARFVVVDAPALFSALWSALKRHVCDDTARKIAFVKWDGKGDPGGNTASELEELGLGGKLGDWILRECRQNRCPVASRVKAYPYARAHEDVLGGSSLETCNVVVDGHDLRGTEEHVAMLRENPELVAGFSAYSSSASSSAAAACSLSAKMVKLGTTN